MHELLHSKEKSLLRCSFMRLIFFISDMRSVAYFSLLLQVVHLVSITDAPVFPLCNWKIACAWSYLTDALIKSILHWVTCMESHWTFVHFSRMFTGHIQKHSDSFGKLSYILCCLGERVIRPPTYRWCNSQHLTGFLCSAARVVIKERLVQVATYFQTWALFSNLYWESIRFGEVGAYKRGVEAVIGVLITNKTRIL